MKIIQCKYIKVINSIFMTTLDWISNIRLNKCIIVNIHLTVKTPVFDAQKNCLILGTHIVFIFHNIKKVFLNNSLKKYFFYHMASHLGLKKPHALKPQVVYRFSGNVLK